MAAPGAPAKFSLALGAKKATAPPSASRRPKSTLRDSDDEDETPRAQHISHFDQAAGGAYDVETREPEKKPLVIEAQPNRNWRDETKRRRQRSSLPGEAGSATGDAAEKRGDTLNGGPQAYGLTVVSSKQDSRDGEGSTAVEEHKPEPAKQLTEDERALAALLGEKAGSNLTIPAVDEDEAFRTDYRDAPDVPTLQDYAAVPIEEFGAALLRGMGWKDGEGVGRGKRQQAAKPRILEKRQALGGIGAKFDPSVMELGSWGKAAKGKEKMNKAPIPILMEDEKTGERVTEEEYKKRLEREKLVEDERPSKRRKQDDLHRDRSRDARDRLRRDRYGSDDDRDKTARDRPRRDHDSDRDYHRRAREGRWRERHGDDEERDRRREDRRRKDRHGSDDEHRHRRKERSRKDRNHGYDDPNRKEWDRRKRDKYERDDEDDVGRDYRERDRNGYKESSSRRTAGYAKSQRQRYEDDPQRRRRDG
ncbi:DExH-box splicing factor binding site-domain-containing protein [Lineolata rhizophorae]|uniref:Pre-mRNA-splicing factor n=1 Tax=Lineolata rhizophorae TaxID=578093 RepID=A0A6A6NZ24_9PEZI|nr:DExH-box splicing factor binding site-domain-containing protein [Lineolata rhizophorae]